ncbi:hypothetical protein GCM10018980_51460 [Streptomyces capoamus]|uniref:Uncharacterized protein n=1 Tax=Streptomyces capoamus TaxID=68183 RepID=A0A919KE28_9ACTN|nr:hypothetical protein [Streptomyces capoamus]GGW15807.1 hypothetical protein GCM10010501_29350 [Streptomyces libani subsp. rufus]GHG61928.1 hypothetical protein GCM10018980_51460 [Streptomyces capoamus]
MGQSTNAMLVYGYHLGGGDSDWLVQDAGEFGELPALDWYNADDEDGDDFITAAEKRLLAQLADFTETDWQVDGYFERERAAKARLGVEFESHCSGDYPMYLLIAKGITAYRGGVKPIDFVALQAEVTQADADAKLRAALDALGLRPTQERAQWLLCSYWG